MQVKPAPGLKVRDPVSKQLYTEADTIEVKETDFFWAKLLEHGDVVLVDEGGAEQ